MYKINGTKQDDKCFLIDHNLEGSFKDGGKSENINIHSFELLFWFPVNMYIRAFKQLKQ